MGLFISFLVSKCHNLFILRSYTNLIFNFKPSWNLHTLPWTVLRIDKNQFDIFILENVKSNALILFFLLMEFYRRIYSLKKPKSWIISNKRCLFYSYFLSLSGMSLLLSQINGLNQKTILCWSSVVVESFA